MRTYAYSIAYGRDNFKPQRTLDRLMTFLYINHMEKDYINVRIKRSVLAKVRRVAVEEKRTTPVIIELAVEDYIKRGRK